MTTLNINKPFNIHRSKHKYPQNDQEWGYYLAGLIDADGSFTDVSKHTLVVFLVSCYCVHKSATVVKFKPFVFLKRLMVSAASVSYVTIYNVCFLYKIGSKTLGFSSI